MAERPKLTVKARAPARDPQRAPVRGGAAPRPAATAAVRNAPARPPAPAPLRVQAGGPVRVQAGVPVRVQARVQARVQVRVQADGPARVPADVPPQPAPQPSARPLALPRPPAPAAADDGIRVSKLITERGLASRREADEWIAAGWVRVNGRLAVLGLRAAPDAQIDIDPRARAEQARRVTVLLHKPIGYVSGQPEDDHEPAAVLIKPDQRWSGDTSGIDFRPGHLLHLAPAGRLDIDSTGLLVFTQDGRIAKRLIGDQTRVEKEYLVRVAFSQPGGLPAEGLELLRHGLELDGVQLRPARVSWQNEDQLRVVLREGRKRQIRRMCEAVGLQVLGLKRVRIGSVVLGPLPPGQWRYLRDDEQF